MKKKIKFIVLCFAIISSVYMIDTSKSRYFSAINLETDIHVAIPQIELVNITNSEEKISPGNTKIVEFDIKNYKDIAINEVLMEYYIVLDIQESSIPLTYEIYQIKGANDEKLTQSSKGFGPVRLTYGQQQNQHFKIIFTWSESDNNFTYADKQFIFKIGVNAEQVI